MNLRLALALGALALLGAFALSTENPAVVLTKKRERKHIEKLKSLLSQQEYDDFIECVGPDHVDNLAEMLIGLGRFSRVIVNNTLKLYREDTRPQDKRVACRGCDYLYQLKTRWDSAYRHRVTEWDAHFEKHLDEVTQQLFELCSKLD
jgi:hypothetical protein